MFRIGDFAKIARVSVKTLHHYDEIDLFKPELVHATTGYRYYSIDQLPRLNRILVLKDLGFTLNQIRSLLNEGLSPSELRGMLRLKEAELTNHILEEQERLVGKRSLTPGLIAHAMTHFFGDPVLIMGILHGAIMLGVIH